MATRVIPVEQCLQSLPKLLEAPSRLVTAQTTRAVGGNEGIHGGDIEEVAQTIVKGRTY